MQLTTIRLPDGRSADFQVAAPSDKPVFFVLGIRKCGSSLLNQMMESLCVINSYQFVDVAGRFFENNILEDNWRSDASIPGMTQLVAPGNVYGGFRAMPSVFEASPYYRDARKILLVRDPRDALVSEYFSNAYSHSLPGHEEGEGRDEFRRMREDALGLDVDAYVRSRAFQMNVTMMEYGSAVHDPLTRLFRYEDVILQKRQWLADMAAHFAWDGGSPDFIDGMMSWADVVPATERKTEFVRRVLPGDHKEKLSRHTIAVLDVILSPAMRLFGYT